MNQNELVKSLSKEEVFFHYICFLSLYILLTYYKVSM